MDDFPFAIATNRAPAELPKSTWPVGLVCSVAENFPIAQLEGRECVLCERPIEPGQDLRPIWMDSHFDLYAHEECPEGGGTR